MSNAVTEIDNAGGRASWVKPFMRGSAGLTILVLALMAGFFYAYSVSVMPGLDDTDGQSAILAMQGINRLVRNPVFFLTFFSPPVLALVAVVTFWIGGERKGALGLLFAGGIYAVGVIVLTASINVPMNNELALLDAATLGDAELVWTIYSERWTFWNSVRGTINVASLLLSFIAFLDIRNQC